MMSMSGITGTSSYVLIFPMGTSVLPTLVYKTLLVSSTCEQRPIAERFSREQLGGRYGKANGREKDS